jgi:hypothetical protein
MKNPIVNWLIHAGRDVWSISSMGYHRAQADTKRDPFMKQPAQFVLLVTDEDRKKYSLQLKKNLYEQK